MVIVYYPRGKEKCITARINTEIEWVLKEEKEYENMKLPLRGRRFNV